MAIVRPDVKQRLVQGETHVIPLQEHWGTRGHQAHLDVTQHTDPDVTIAIDLEMSMDGGRTWTYGGGWTLAGGDHSVDKNGDPIIYHNTTWGIEHAAASPCLRRLVRGYVHILPTRSPYVAQIQIPGAPCLQGPGGDKHWKASVARDVRYVAPGAEPLAVHTRVHVAGVKTPSVDKSLIPVD